MLQRYRFHHLLSWCLFLGLFLWCDGSAVAQSGPYGNEWIVPGQPYYKIKVAQNGLYKLDYQYLTQAGLSSADPRRLQLWRRGKEVAIYVGGNQTALDPTTFVEFYGQRNDGQLDRGMYKNASDQPHNLYSLYTDTAAYFLTVAATAQGKRMSESNLAGTGTPHPYRMQTSLKIQKDNYSNVSLSSLVWQSWADPQEGFLSAELAYGNVGYSSADSVRSVSPLGPQPRVEILLAGSSNANHVTKVSTFTVSGGTPQLDVIQYFGYVQVKRTYELRRDYIINQNDRRIVMRFDAVNPTPTGGTPDRYRMGYTRFTYPQTNRWFSNRRSIAFSNDSTLSEQPYFVLDTIPATTHGYDVTDAYNVQRIEGQSVTSTKRGFVFPAAVGRTRQLLVADMARPLVPLPAQRIRFRTIAPSAHNFLIVSNTALMKPVGSVANPVRTYADYRASVAGGRYDTLVVTTEQLYNQFHYGEKSALAIRQFAQWMLTDSRAKNLLLLGKGLITGESLGLYHRQAPNTWAVKDLVPTSTRSASDAFFTADWQKDDYVAKMATGRISAQTPTEVLNYLNKLKEHEATGIAPWRKNVLHLAGGEDPAQFAQFQGYLNNYRLHVERPLFGGKVVKTYTRSTVGSYDSFPVNINIASELNKGLSLMTYFGHGSLNTFDLNLGNVNDPTNNYNNKGKYPIMFFYGCAAGNAFTIGDSNISFGTQWTLAADRGLIGFMAESSFGFDGNLDTYADLLYKLLFNEPDWYGKPVAVVQNEVARRLMPIYVSSTPGVSNAAGINMLMSTIWQGDPALKLYAPAKPDLATADSLLQIKPIGTGPVQASSDRFNLLVKVKNTGKVTYDSVRISVSRQITGQAPRLITPKAFRQAWRDTTYAIEIPNTGVVFGDNRFVVNVDYKNEVDELDESNNQASINFSFLQGGVTALNPPEFGIVASNTVHLVGQTNDLKGGARKFDMELDTVPTFNSPLARRTQVDGTLLAEWRPTLPSIAGRDSVVWYWRLRFQSPQTGENPDWATSSFRVITGSTGGWSQSHHGQFQRDALTDGLNVAAPSGKWAFSEITQGLTLRTQGGSTGAGSTFQNSYGITVLNSSSPFVNNCSTGLPNILVAVFNGRSFKRVPKFGNRYYICGQEDQFFYHFASSSSDNINTSAEQNQLLALLNEVPEGAYVAMVSMNRVNFSTFTPALKAKLASLGSRLINQLQDGDPFALVGQVGAGANPVQELSYDASSTVPRAEQVVALNATMRTQTGKATITSTRIGPAQQWNTLYHTVRTEPSDSYTLSLVGINAAGTETVLNASVTDRTFALSSISAKEYPYLQLVLEMRDTLNRTAPQLEQWLVAYQGVPEGVVRRDLVTPATAYDAATLLQQATSTGYITLPVTFQNVSAVDFGTPLKARITVRDGKNVVRTDDVTAPATLKADGSLVFPVKLNVIGLSGTITGEVDVNPRLLPELNYFNNQLPLPAFTVPDNNVPPVLDVAFDGLHILNGDIVSPTPTIVVQLKDENRLQPVTKARNFNLYLTRPGQATPVQVDMANSNIVFSADSAKGIARVEYQPGKATPLLDGVYTLEAQARDANNSAAGTENYKISFEVISASTITNVFPYPNPVTSKAKFVFTLTGSELPRNMKIQIMTLTGKVVREILMNELGPLHIGNNITEYAWNGTDEFGDQLANGTYLYRVVMDDPTSQFGHRRTAADKAFKKDWGKLVLLR
ncbi:putative type IX secretion system sortase PorU2 [Hymenobacter crusticola]|nr:C25 family cysteine peptidase [Hymenobacter crusticola]